MDRELVQVGLRELPGTAATDPRKQLQGLGAVSLLALVPRAARVGDYTIEPAEVGGYTFAGRHAAIVIMQGRIGKGVIPTLRPATLDPTQASARYASAPTG
jgi:hypothetical protein